MRKCIILASTLTALFVASSAFAATPVTEPPLPSDIGTYALQQKMCDKYPGKVLTMDVYDRQTAVSQSRVLVINLNGKKVRQNEWSINKSDITHFVLFVRNSPAENWLEYNTRETNTEANTRFYSEVGLTYEELAACDK